jgi:uncharacterized protein YjaG (DUF416 family)
MTRSEFKNLFDAKTDRLNPDQLIGFGLNICERLLPEYITFSEKHHWGNVELLKECIELARFSKGRELSHSDIKSYLNKLDPIIPDTEDFGDFDGSYALNASAAVYELMMYLIDKNPQHIYSISIYMTDTVDFKLSEADLSLSNQILENHLDIIDEWRYQLRLLADVEIETKGVKFDPTFNYGASDLSDDRNLAFYKFAELIKILITLSSNAERQIEIMGYGAVCDEMAEDFHTYFTLSFNSYVEYGLMETDQVVKLTDLDIFLEQQSGDKSPEFWDDLTLATNPEWNVVSQMAFNILKSMGMDGLALKFDRKEEYKWTWKGKRLVSQFTKTWLERP